MGSVIFDPSPHDPVHPSARTPLPVLTDQKVFLFLASFSLLASVTLEKLMRKKGWSTTSNGTASRGKRARKKGIGVD